MKEHVIVVLALVEIASCIRLWTTNIPGRGLLLNIELRRQLKKGLDVCRSLSIYDEHVKPSASNSTVLCRCAWAEGDNVLVRCRSRLELKFPVYILQVRNEYGEPIGKWDDDGFHTRIDCPPGKLVIFINH